jgi:hypothetical protein
VTVRRIAIVYVAASVAALFFGILLMKAMWPMNGFYVPFVFFALGPLAALSFTVHDSIAAGMNKWSFEWLGLFIYLLATGFVAVCIALCRHDTRLVRVIGYVAGTLGWMASGFFVFVMLMGA